MGDARSAIPLQPTARPTGTFRVNARLQPAPSHARLVARVEALEYQRSVDVAMRLRAAGAVERAALRAGETELAVRARLVRADMLQRGGHLAQGAALAGDVNRWAAEEGSASVLACSHLVLSSVIESAGDAARGLEHAVIALELADDGTPPRSLGNYLLRLADALAFDGQLEAARERYAAARQVFARIGDTEREINALNNLAYTECDGGDPRLAIEFALEARRVADRAGVAPNPEFADALAPAQQALDACLRICRERDLAALQARALAEQAEIQAAAGDFAAAYATHRRYHAETVQLASARREAAARTRHALLETAEARREAERYWRQARTDPLSGLPNRRAVDEELPGLLGALPAGARMVVAIVDADHFKVINDTWSHEAGDRAIAALGRILDRSVRGRPRAVASEPARAAAPSRFVARRGGEEFVVVLPPGVKQPAIVLERLRRAVERYDWTGLLGIGALTVSIGATAAGPGETPAAVLRRADQPHYVAKRNGRNGVRHDLPAIRDSLVLVARGRRARSAS